MLHRFKLAGSLTTGLLIVTFGLAGCGGATDTATPATLIEVATATTAIQATAATTTAPVPVVAPTGNAVAPAAAPTTASTGATGAATAVAPASTATTLSAGQTVTVQATLREWALDLSETQVSAGAIHFVIANTGTMAHNFTIKDSNGVVAKTTNFSPGQSPQTLDVTLPAGTYTVYCSLPGHAARGQQNTLVVK